MIMGLQKISRLSAYHGCLLALSVFFFFLATTGIRTHAHPCLQALSLSVSQMHNPTYSARKARTIAFLVTPKTHPFDVY